MKISVYIPSYNQKAYLIEALESVLAQTLRPHQIIIADDASTDGSRDVIRGYAARYPGLITPILHTKNTGVTRTRIDALQAVTGDYVSYVDGDDRYRPEKLEREAQTLREHPNAGLVYSNVAYFAPEGESHRWLPDSYSPPQGSILWQTLARAFPRRNIFRMELVHYPRWKNIGFHDEALPIYEDWEMRIRLTQHLRACYCPKTLSEVRLHGRGLSSMPSKRHLEALNYIRQKHAATMRQLPCSQRLRVWTGLRTWEGKLYRGYARQLAGIHPAHKWPALRAYLKALSLDPTSPKPAVLWKILRLPSPGRRL